MKFSAVALLAVTASAGVAPRDAATVQGVLSSVEDATSAVDKAAKAYTGGTPTAALNAASDLVDAIKAGESKVAGAGTLGVADAAALAPAVQSLTTVSKQLVSDLVAKRDQVEKAGQCSQVRDSVSAVADSGNTLIKDVISHVEKVAQEVASQLAAPLTSVLAQAVDDFSESNCKDASGGGSGSSSSAAAPTSTSAAAATSSSAAAATSSSAAEATTTGYPVPSSSSAAAATTTPASVPTTSAPASTPTVPVAGASLVAPAGVLALALAVFAL